jgi:hypothetical protein
MYQSAMKASIFKFIIDGFHSLRFLRVDVLKTYIKICIKFLVKQTSSHFSMHCLLYALNKVGLFLDIRSCACLISIFYDIQARTHYTLYYIILLPINRSHTDNISIALETQYLRIVNELVNKVL